MDMRRGMDGRRLPPRNSRGEFRRRRSRRDRGMDGNYDMNYTGGRGGYPMRDMGDMNYDMRGMDGHHPQAHGQTYYPIEAMGTFNGYYGMPEQDYARGGRGGRQDYGYDMRYDMRGGRRDYGYDYGYDDYGYDYGDYGQTLTEAELEKWCHKLKSQLDDREKQMFSKENITQRAKQMGKPMEGFGEKELEVATLMIYTDYKQSIGQNLDLSIKLAYDWLTDKDVAVKGAEKLAVYYDCIVEGSDD